MEFVLTHPDTGLKSIVVLFDGVPYEADSNHPWWDEIIYGCFDDDPRVLDLFPIRPVQQPSEEVPFVGSQWIPRSIKEFDAEDDGAAESREAEYTAHEILEEGSWMPRTSLPLAAHIIAEDRRPPDAQAREEISAHLNRMPVTDSAQSKRTIEGLSMQVGNLSAREAVAHQTLDEFGAPRDDPRSGYALNVNGRLTEHICDLNEEIERLTIERDRELNASAGFEGLRDDAMRRVLVLTSQLANERTEGDRQCQIAQDRLRTIGFLEAAMRTYADHAWNDIKHELETRGWL